MNTEAHSDTASVFSHRTRGRRHGPINRLISPGDLGRILKPFDEDVGLDALLGLVEDRPDRQVVLDFLEGLLDFGELDVERPQRVGLLRREVGAQQVATVLL